MSKKSEDAGMDIVVSEGWEAGGDNAFDNVTSLVLITQVVQSVKMPVVAAGGIGDARGFIEALTMGTEGEQMGTHFVATRECVAPTSSDLF